MKKQIYLCLLLLLGTITYVQAQCTVSSISSELTRGYRMQGGGTTQFTATSNGTLSWSIVAGASTITQSGLVTWDPAFTGSARISATASGTCGTPATRTTNIQVYPIPTCAAPSTGNTTRCNSGTLTANTYSAMVTGHRWYTAPTGGSEITPTTSNLVATSVWYSTLEVTGSTPVTYYVSSVCGSSESARTAVTYTPSTTACRYTTPDVELLSQVTVSPNPIINDAKISYNLQENEKVTLEVLDLQGNKLATILENSLETAGVHSVIFDAKKIGVQSNLFVLKIKAGNKVIVKKIIIN